MGRQVKSVKKMDALNRKVAKKVGGPNINKANGKPFDKADKKDEVMSKSVRAKKLIRAKEAKLDRQFQQKQLALKLREMP